MRDLALSQPARFDLTTGRVWIMGVLNATPDSFYADSRVAGIPQALAKAEAMIREGADLLDVGGESTRPGAAPISAALERERVLPLIEALRQQWPQMPLSIDTQKAEVAHEALARGVHLVNDVSALRHDPAMAEAVATGGGDVVLMHMQGTPETMQANPQYRDIMDELKNFFEERLTAAVRAGIAEEKVVLDPGIGFGKTLEHNLTILRQLSRLTSFGRPILVGLSRKSFVARLQAALPGQTPPPENRLEGTLAATLWAVQQGARGVRTHDVAATRQALNMWQTLQTEPRS
jgi:dihydropteroate synthase